MVVGTVLGDPGIDPRQVDTDCPICGAPVEVAYDDEVMAASCADCEGISRWNETPGILYVGLVPPACIEERPVETAYGRASPTRSTRLPPRFRSGRSALDRVGATWEPVVRKLETGNRPTGPPHALKPFSLFNMKWSLGPTQMARATPA